MEENQKVPRKRKGKKLLDSFKFSEKDLGPFCGMIPTCFQLVEIFEPFWDLDVGLGNQILPILIMTWYLK